MPHLLFRAGRYYYNRRVPKKLREFDPREIIRISLETDSLTDAERKSVIIHEQIESYWQKLVAAGDTHTDKAFHRAVALARLLGFSYRANRDLADPESPFLELGKRYLEVAKSKNNKRHAEALLGGISPPVATVSAALEKFWTLTKNRVMNKTEDQIRKWRNPRIRAVNNFIEKVGDKPLTSVTREDIIQFRDSWIDRIENEKVDIGTANKDFIHLKNVIQTVVEHDRIELNTSHLFHKITLQKRFEKARVPLTKKEIHAILNSKELQNLNDEARWFLHAAAETGARPSELVGLLPEDIVLNAKIPHIKLVDRPDRMLKNAHSAREIPLVGYALDAFRAKPNGFPHYRDKPDNLSNHLNKFLREHKLLPTERHSVYSLRHSFQDRILSVNAPDRVQAELMGHKFHRPVYGDGPTLGHKLQWLKKVQLKK